MGRSQRQKGCREERMALEWWQKLGVDGRRTAASGAMLGHKGDLEIQLFEVLHVECKSRKDGKGFVQLEGWLGDCDVLQLRRNGQEPMFLLPARVMASFVEAVRDLEEITVNGDGLAGLAPAKEEGDTNVKSESDGT